MRWLAKHWVRIDSDPYREKDTGIPCGLSHSVEIGEFREIVLTHCNCGRIFTNGKPNDFDRFNEHIRPRGVIVPMH